MGKTMSIKIKILTGFIILAAMLLVAGVWSIVEVRSIGDSLSSILDNEYQSINASGKMKEAIEALDNEILLKLSDFSSPIDIEKQKNIFLAELENARKISNVDKENKLLNDVEQNFQQFISEINYLSKSGNTANGLEWYFQHPHKVMVEIISSIDLYMAHNDKVMYDNSASIVEKSQRAIMPGIVAIIAAIVFTLLFQSLVSFYFINPIIIITEKIRKFTSKRIPYDYTVETNDEISELNDAVEILCSHVIAEED